jgi:hypothetical protein
MVLFLLAMASPLAAQTIRGRVVLASDGTPLPGVTVSVDDWGLTTVTDTDGQYTLNAAGRSGTARVTAMLTGFQRAPRR